MMRMRMMHGATFLSLFRLEKAGRRWHNRSHKQQDSHTDFSLFPPPTGLSLHVRKSETRHIEALSTPPLCAGSGSGSRPPEVGRKMISFFVRHNSI
jgi:hypothetical protein